MKTLQYISIILLVTLLTACQSATPAPIIATTGAEFTLAIDQTVTLENTELSITLTSVPGDQRCPLKIECAMSGPVTVSITVRSGSNAPEEIVFQTFTDNDGHAPPLSFQGIQDQVEYEGYLIQIESVLPFPQRSVNEIRDSEYRVSFVVTQK
jgi:hypothetical protein